MPRVIRLYRAPYSTNVERVALALAHKGLEAESVVIDYSDRSAVEEVSGQGLVPVIDDDGHVVSDSRAILRYLEERHPDPPLWPADPVAAAWLETFFEWFDEVWKVPPNAIEAELEKDSPDAAAIDAWSARMEGWLDRFERMLEGRDHLLGELSAADFLAFPFLKYARGRDPEDPDLFHAVLDDHMGLDGRPNLAAWIERIDGLPRV